jgi:hypothetical protein
MKLTVKIIKIISFQEILPFSILTVLGSVFVVIPSKRSDIILKNVFLIFMLMSLVTHRNNDRLLQLPIIAANVNSTGPKQNKNQGAYVS